MNVQVCVNCVMDTSDKSIVFNEMGICNYCSSYEEKKMQYIFSDKKEEQNITDLKNRIFKRKRNKYDSLIGLSGGVDSSYLALLAFKMGLNPLCVHFDNGWNSDTALENIQKIISKTGYDLQTYVINWDEFRDLQRSFFKAGVIDIEMITDHAIFASLFKIRKKYKIKTVLSGTNFATEQDMPPNWSWYKMDAKNIKSIHKNFGELKLKTFPFMNSLKWEMIKRFQLGGIFEEPLNLINYSKNNAISELNSFFDWNYYGEKHYESVFTKFYQAYVLPVKFNIDKRKVHYSDLIRNKEISRDEALIKLSTPLYPDKHEFNQEKAYILKKLGFSNEFFLEYMNSIPINHSYYKTDTKMINLLERLYYFLKPRKF